MSYIDNGSTNSQVPVNAVLNAGRVKQREVPVVASTAIEAGTFLAANGSGKFDVATGSSVGLVLLKQATKASDADFASASKKRLVSESVELGVVFEIGVGAGSASASSVGGRFNLAAGGKTLDLTAAGTQFEVTGVPSATRVQAKIVVA